MKHLSLTDEQFKLIVHLCNEDLNALEIVLSDNHYPRSVVSLIELKKNEITALLTEIEFQNE